MRSETATVANANAPEEAAAASMRKATARALRRLVGSRSGAVIALFVLVAAFALPLRGLLRAPGPPMEEGFMLVFPERILRGDIPNENFLHLYGPGSLWVLAGTFKVFGTSLLTERMVGLLQQLAVVFGVFWLARRWGRTVALGCALTAVLFIAPLGLTALAWLGAVGLGLLVLAIGAASRDAVDPRRAQRLALLAGLLAGFTLLYRIDLVLALALAAAALGWGVARTLRGRFIKGLAIGLAPYLVHLATAGPDTVGRGMILDPVFNLRGGRHLPIPPPWSHFASGGQGVVDLYKLPWPVPTLAGPAQISLWFFFLLAAMVVLVAVGVSAVRRDPSSLRPRVLLAVAGFSVGILPQALQRADTTHLAWVSCVAIAFLPVAAVQAIHNRRPHWRQRTIGAGAGAALLVLLTLLLTNYTTRSYASYSAQTFGVHRRSSLISHRGRNFYYGRASNAAAANRMLDEVERISKPGNRLFVGPTDLRKTPYSDAFFYYLLPQLRPATYYIEMDPGIANANDSGLANEIRHSDILILSATWNQSNEPNDSRKFGPNEPNEVVRKQFCLVGRYGSDYRLYRHCHP